MKIVLENIRSFVGRHEIPLTPLTLLTGENSSGKTTFLASIAVITGQSGMPFSPRVNDAPFNLGNYDTVVTKINRRPSASSFTIGLNEDSPFQNIKKFYSAKYQSVSGKIDLSEFRIRHDSDETSSGISIVKDIDLYSANLIHQGEEIFLGLISKNESLDLGFHQLSFKLFSLFTGSEVNDLKDKTEDLTSIISNLTYYSSNIKVISNMFDQLPGGMNTLALSPVRTHPRRTYDRITQEFTPDGAHIPYILTEVLENPTYKSRLIEFGRASKLYSTLSVKQLGKSMSDPSQVMVSDSKNVSNLVDVGYGVSQALPVVIESIMAPQNTRLLIQQPEVHLHPRAQAALGSLFVDLVANDKKEFVVETHSDYIIDRVRMEVAQGKIDSKDVSILYFEKNGFETTVHQLTLNECGEIQNAPPSYREFFLEEMVDLLYRTEL